MAAHVKQLGIPEEYLQELVTGMEMDLTHTRYATFDDLYPYCYRVASIVGLICLKVFGTQDPRAQEYAINLGVAFQLTNILRDVGTDADRQRIYLPQEDLAKFKYTEQQLFTKTNSSEFLELMQFEAARAHEFYDKAQAVYDTLSRSDRQSLLAAEIMRSIYFRILNRIQHSNYAVFESRIRAQEYAINLGVAFQLTNILRDVGTDADRQRIYLPQEDLAKFKYTEQQLFTKTNSSEFLELMQFEAARAHEFYDKAQAVYDTLSRSDRQSQAV